MTSQELIIETENLSKSYGDVTALKSLSLKVPKNSIFGFLGPNGAGKTTTIKLLLGLACARAAIIRMHFIILIEDPRN